MKRTIGILGRRRSGAGREPHGPCALRDWGSRSTIHRLTCRPHETAFQTTATAINTAEIIANQVLDLTALEAWALDAGTWAADLQQIQALVLQAEGLAWDVESLDAQITALFGLEGAPMTSLEFRDRQQEIRHYMYLSWSYAMRTQTLVQTLLSTVDHLLGIYETLPGYHRQ